MDFKERRAMLLELNSREVLEMHGISVSMKNTARCINPEHNDRRPSMHVYPGNRGCHCFACGFSGNNIQIVEATEGVDFKEAEEILAKEFNLPSKEEIMHDRKKSGDFKPKATYKQFTLTKDQIMALQFEEYGQVAKCKSNSCLYPGNQADFVYDTKSDDNPYVLTYTPINISLQQLFREDEEGFDYMVSERARERYNWFFQMYDSIFWQKGPFRAINKPGFMTVEKQAIELLIETLEPLAKKYGFYRPLKKKSTFAVA